MFGQSSDIIQWHMKCEIGHLLSPHSKRHGRRPNLVLLDFMSPLRDVSFKVVNGCKILEAACVVVQMSNRKDIYMNAPICCKFKH